MITIVAKEKARLAPKGAPKFAPAARPKTVTKRPGAEADQFLMNFMIRLDFPGSSLQMGSSFCHSYSSECEEPAGIMTSTKVPGNLDFMRRPSCSCKRGHILHALIAGCLPLA